MQDSSYLPSPSDEHSSGNCAAATSETNDVARLMAMTEPEIDAELRSMGMDPDETAARGKRAVERALAEIRLTGQLGVAVALLGECVGPLEVSAAIIEDEDGGEAIETLIARVKAFVEACHLNRAPRSTSVTVDEVAALARHMWRDEVLPGRVLVFGGAVLGLVDAALAAAPSRGLGDRSGPNEKDPV